MALDELAEDVARLRWCSHRLDHLQMSPEHRPGLLRTEAKLDHVGQLLQRVGKPT